MPGAVPVPPITVPPSTVPAPPTAEAAPPVPAAPPTEDVGPGPFEELHKKTKEIFPVPFEGAKLIVNKGLSNHFQVTHTATMSSLAPSGYKFGATYVDTREFSPGSQQEPSTILIGDIDPSANLNANIIHQITRAARCKFVAAVQGGRWSATQLSAEYLGKDTSAALTLGNPDPLNGAGVIVAQYMRQVARGFTAGAELMYQRGASMPGGQLAVCTLGTRYAGSDWQFSANYTPMAKAVHACFYQKVNADVSIGAELEVNPRAQEATGTLGYQLELPSAAVTFRGQLDSNYCVGAVLEKRLPPMPFTLALSAFANHQKHSYRFGIGLIVG